MMAPDLVVATELIRVDAVALEWFGLDERVAIGPHRRGFVQSVAARSAAKAAVKRVLESRALPEDLMPAMTDIAFAGDRYGRVAVELPADVAEWLTNHGVGVAVSLAHERTCGFGAVVAAPTRQDSVAAGSAD